MIIGTGIDIVEINRFKKIKDLKGIAKKILHTNELEEFNKKAKDQTIFPVSYTHLTLPTSSVV